MEVQNAWEGFKTLKSELNHVLASGLFLVTISQLTHFTGHHSESTQLLVATLINLGFICFAQLKSNGIKGLFRWGDVSVRTLASFAVLLMSAVIVSAVVKSDFLSDKMSVSAELERVILSGATNLGLYAVIRIATNFLVAFAMTFFTTGFIFINRYTEQFK
ncbi:uncharacterized protein LOC118436466 [Folsomia candida]|uniref:uncharacterized protein LOC118436466 n=1 Tax=Folsomia candida TaxID=158441 RepID=UPI0016055947|nr:uncharacterized protein LOC118436466 [Folsomia candida]